MAGALRDTPFPRLEKAFAGIELHWATKAAIEDIAHHESDKLVKVMIFPDGTGGKGGGGPAFAFVVIGVT